MEKKNLLEIKNLSITYKTEDGIVHAVQNLNLNLGEKETLGLVGETGAGKTSTALGILQLLQEPVGKVKEGEILFKGEDLLKKSKNEMRSIRGKEISMIFQDPMTSLDPVQSVGDQIAEVILLHQKVDKKQADELAKAMLEKVGIEGSRSTNYPHEFSGGMKQRVVIAIALACNPKFLIADEPTTALDVTIQAQVLKLMANLKEEYATSMLLITHDLGIVAETCDKVAIMYAGSILEYGDLEAIYEHPSHPYTLGLFGSIPNLESDDARLKEISGLPPDPTNLPKGCRFAPRCEKAMEKCLTEVPEDYVISEGHYAKCFLFCKQKDL